jgi:hypothetical protein
MTVGDGHASRTALTCDDKKQIELSYVAKRLIVSVSSAFITRWSTVAVSHTTVTTVQAAIQLLTAGTHGFCADGHFRNIRRLNITKCMKQGLARTCHADLALQQQRKECGTTTADSLQTAGRSKKINTACSRP